jgi:hypothetical protein
VNANDMRDIYFIYRATAGPVLAQHRFVPQPSWATAAAVAAPREEVKSMKKLVRKARHALRTLSAVGFGHGILIGN